MLLLYSTDLKAIATAAAAAVALTKTTTGPPIHPIAILSRDTTPSSPTTLPFPAYRDTTGNFAHLYHPDTPTAFVIRPDGYLGPRFPLTETTTALSSYFTTLDR
ncbi:hypothetical protein OG352_19760 [Streptomyces sp. NBC_01485]